MRRADRERTDAAFFDEVFASAEVVFLALHNGEYPYCVPLNFMREGDHLYIHCALEGLKLDCIRRDNHVGFSCVGELVVDPEHSTVYFKSLCGTGTAHIVEDEAEKQRVLAAIGSRYAARCPRPTPEAMAARVLILRIDILTLTGKAKVAQAPAATA